VLEKQGCLMQQRIAVIGAGVSGLTCGVVLADRGFRVAIFAKETGQQTTSGAAAALWFPYDAKPAEKVIPWALETYNVLVDLCDDPGSGVSIIELRQFSRTGEIQVPDWAISLGASVIPSSPSVMSSQVETSLAVNSSFFKSGFALTVPLMDTTVYLDYLAKRLLKASGEITIATFEKLEDVPRKFDLMINCAGIGARELAQDRDLEPHRGQVAIVPKIGNLSCAIVCDDAPLMYAIPRANDGVLGGTNEISDDLDVDPRSTARILDECSRVLKIDKPSIVAERVGLRPFRRSGVRLERDQLRDGRTVIHNYGHGGAGFTLAWGCAHDAVDLAAGVCRSG
jgi:D-amino-acid oxidase